MPLRLTFLIPVIMTEEENPVDPEANKAIARRYFSEMVD
jgi:hypothetical protein